MQFVIDKEYLNSLEKLTDRTKKYSNLYDYMVDATLNCDTDEHQVRVWYSTVYETKQAVYDLKDIKRCEVHATGCLLLFRDRKFLFLPITDNEDNDLDLFEMCELLEGKLDGLHFFVIERLSFLVDEQRGKRIRVGVSLSDSPTVMIIMSLLAIVIATFFVMEKKDFSLVERSECQMYTGTFESYKEDDNDYIQLYFSDEDVFWVHYVCGSDFFFDKLDSLEKGELITVLVNPNIDYVVEIRTEELEILNFKSSQIKMQEEATRFMWLGIVLYFCAAFFFIYGIKHLIKEKKVCF